jgi:DtxR family Mn-dependent transcriptional regulator
VIVDPHGSPIPTREGLVVAPDEELLLSELRPGEEGLVTRVEDEDPTILRALSALGLVPGQRVRLVAATGDGLRVTLGEHEDVVPRRVARTVFVSRSRSVSSEATSRS